MASNLSDDKELLGAAENGLQVNTDCDNDDRNEIRDGCHIGCIFCDSYMTAVVESARVLPCLHVACQSCLIRFLTDKYVMQENRHFSGVVFSCPRCSYMIQLPHDGVDGLKTASFFQSNRLLVPRLSSNVDKSMTRCLTGSDPFAGGYNSISLPIDTLVDSERHTCGSATRSAINCSQADSVSVEVSSVSTQGSGDGGQRSIRGDHVESVRSKVSRLSADTVLRRRQCHQAIRQIQLAASDLETRKTALRDTISTRAHHLCHLICSRRDQLLDELDREYSQCAADYTRQASALDAHSATLHYSCQFADALMCAGYAADDDLHANVIDRINQLLVSDVVRPPSAAGSGVAVPEFTAIRVDVPDAQHEESHLEKLFGGLVKGTLGTVELLTSFNSDLQWPAGFVVVGSGRESVLVGKAGAFADEGHVLFYDRNGVCVHRHSLASSHLPVDVAVVSGEVLVSDVSGRISKFTPDGRLVDEWRQVFQGTSGHMAVNGDQVLVSSATECCIHRYKSTDGRRVGTVSLDWHAADSQLTTTPDLTAITLSSAGVIIATASNVSGPCFFSSDGQFLRSCCTTRTCDRTPRQQATQQIALPSAVCCDAFDNVLVADFVGNCVHLVSADGLYLGQLLTKTSHGVACPNFVTLDHEGRLYVGQYGGDVLVFQYLSYVKHV